EQVAVIWAGTNGYLDDVPVEDILRFEREFLDYLGNNSEALNTLRSTNVLDDDTVAELQAKIEAFKLEFRTSAGQSLNEQFQELGEDEIKQEQLVVGKK
ncbi:MAG: F0F1 ATP synthase subunit alpha, partial [Actinobacteria bacterium]|nr:F0F1 ATP synthase subunit alpha [Actinomycetota bacterium]